ncbi:MAG: stage II sporulation protein P [Firmicutes bacterium HGW-Firmicutes-15]|nr:MAG: stage II sporulation protein P [Firmicutes bacterium HGW-Firmicutes-15]
MDTINRRYIWLFFSILITIMVGAYIFNIIKAPSLSKPYILRSDAGEQTNSYYVVKDTLGVTILETGLPVQVDDQYIDEHNVQYIVLKVDGKNAVADIVTKKEDSTNNSSGVSAMNLPYYKKSIPAQAAPGTHVVIYHTHTDESYVPTSAKASQPGAGDIYQVGNILTDSLQKSGVSVTHSTNAHDPHDINAYHRSRKTVTQLLTEGPDAAFDIHRDSAPASAYITSINGVDTSRVMIVMGRSNPNMKTNLQYAKKIKAEADNLYPGLVRGIFMGKGSYNQDLYPTALLFEVGTETISLDLAENGVRFLSDVITHVLASS